MHKHYERVKVDLAAKEKALAEMSQEYLILKKSELGIAGKMKGKKVGKEAQAGLVQVIQESELSVEKCCEILQLSDRRYYRWINWTEPEKRMPWNKIKPEENEEILKAAGAEALCGLRAAGLMVYGHESGKYSCSISTIQKVLKKHDLEAPYTPPRRM